MSMASGAPAGQGSRLNNLLSQWKSKAGAVLDPIKERVIDTTTRIIGLEHLVQTQQDEIRQLAEKLALINEQVLTHLSPSSDLDGPTLKLLQDLADAAAEVEAYLNSLASPSKRLQQLSGPVELRNLHHRLDSVASHLGLVYSVTVGLRVERLEREAAGYMVAEIPEDLLLVEVPPNPAIFYGRDELVESIVQLLCRDQTCRIPLLGPGGIGKTSVAAAVVNNARVKAKYGRYILFVSCEGLVSAEGIINALAAALHLRHDSNILRTVLSYLSAQRCILLVLDNLETAWDSPDRVNVEQLLAKLAALPGLSLIVTIRGAVRPASINWADTCVAPLAPLSLDASREMWLSIARSRDDNLDKLLAMLDGLPLAVFLMAHQGQLMSPTELLEAYEAEKTALLETQAGGRLTSLDVSIQISMNSHTMSQNPKAKEVLSVLSLLPVGIPIATLPRVLRSTANTRKSALALCAVTLAFNDKGRLRALSPIRDFVLEHFPPTGASLTETRAYFNGLTIEADKLGTPQARQAITLLSTEFGNINSVLLHCWKDAQCQNDADALVLATDRLSIFSSHARFGDCIPLLSEAKNHLEEMDHRRGAARCTQTIGHTLALRAQYMQALPMLEEAEAMFEVIGDRVGVAQCKRSTGDVLHMLDRYDEGLAKLEEAKAEFDDMSDRQGSATCQRSIANVFRMQSRYAEALEQLKKAQAEFDVDDDRLGVATCILGIGNLLTMLARYDEALAKLQHAKSEFERVNARHNTAVCVRAMGDVLRILARYDDAVAKLEEARTEFEDLGDRPNAAHCTHSIGNILYMQARYADALAKMEEAKAAFEALGDRLGRAQCTRTIGDVLCMFARYREALENLSQAKTDFQAIGDVLGAARCTRSIGDILALLGRFDEALPNMESAKTVFEAIGDRKGAGKCAQTIGNLLAAVRRYDAALVNMEQAKATFEAIGDRLGAANCTQSIGNVFRVQERYDEALAKFEQTTAEFKVIGNRLGIARCTQGVGDVLCMLDRQDEALVKLEEAKTEFEIIGDRLGAAQCMRSMGKVLAQLARYGDAIVMLELARAASEAIGDGPGYAECLRILARMTGS
ncbi:TPR-like protein [Calocera viscosa TUFC12733]|uniref:TPR-like protein n=1 Tax=Calocera viscosa (strain TUFC12733) TaxID=1330018 RepID=A0A167M945_CALVF|nr:TPR-like protein [Calocera viscosa TUFC12733]